MDLVDESNTEGMIEVLREEREEYVISCERQRQELHEKNAQASGPEEEKEQVDKATDVDLDTNDLEVRYFKFFEANPEFSFSEQIR